MKDLKSFIKKVWKSTLNKSTYVVEGYSEGEIYHAPLLIDFKKEWKSLSSSDMKLLLQKELYKSEWHHVEAANISEFLKLFKLSRNQSKDQNEYIDIENNEATGVTKDPHSTLKNRRKHQRLTRDEKQLIFKKSKIEKKWM